MVHFDESDKFSDAKKIITEEFSTAQWGKVLIIIFPQSTLSRDIENVTLGLRHVYFNYHKKHIYIFSGWNHHSCPGISRFSAVHYKLKKIL